MINRSGTKKLFMQHKIAGSNRLRLEEDTVITKRLKMGDSVKVLEQTPISDEKSVDVQSKMYPSHRTRMPVDIDIKIESDPRDGDDWCIGGDISKQDDKLQNVELDSNGANSNIFDNCVPTEYTIEFVDEDCKFDKVYCKVGNNTMIDESENKGRENNNSYNQNNNNLHTQEENKCDVLTVKELIDVKSKDHIKDFIKKIEKIEKDTKAAFEDTNPYNNKCLTKRRHSCTICNKEYTYKTWRSHIKNVHGDKNHECAICGAKFKCERYLKKHNLYWHENGIKASQRPNRQSCPECPKTFKNSDSLGQHIKNCHANQVECELCFSRLKSPAYLKTHMRRVHYDDGKVHKCKICCKKFKSSRQVKIHVKNLHPDTLHPCPNCIRLFGNASQLTIHLKKCKPNFDPTDDSNGKVDEIDETVDLTVD
ncbi:hypothetical protein O0L34_g6770 [Tuta absoluta]|nr:hypothetical protein O0L34_g6770 [Tuta absoluta]